MAGSLGICCVMVGLRLALAMASLATGAASAEPGHQGSDVANNFAGFTHSGADDKYSLMDACDPSNPIRMHTDGTNGVALDGAETGRGDPKVPQDARVLPRPDQAVEKPADYVLMPRNEQAAAAPADGPSACGSTSLAVSGMMCVGMALLGLFMA